MTTQSTEMNELKYLILLLLSIWFIRSERCRMGWRYSHDYNARQCFIVWCFVNMNLKNVWKIWRRWRPTTLERRSVNQVGDRGIRPNVQWENWEGWSQTIYLWSEEGMKTGGLTRLWWGYSLSESGNPNWDWSDENQSSRSENPVLTLSYLGHGLEGRHLTASQEMQVRSSPRALFVFVSFSQSEEMKRKLLNRSEKVRRSPQTTNFWFPGGIRIPASRAPTSFHFDLLLHLYNYKERNLDLPIVESTNMRTLASCYPNWLTANKLCSAFLFPGLDL